MVQIVIILMISHGRIKVTVIIAIVIISSIAVVSSICGIVDDIMIKFSDCELFCNL